ncbi:MAG: hypothetical protein OXD31_15660 [Chloroflexi bacterium]|nr:hypothetical protein [Chloroflexota bacterium]
MAAPVMVSFGWTGENREIKVVQQDDAWYTEHLIDGEPDQQLIKLFGTNVIPTPWSSDSDKSTVMEELTVRNPNSSVS